MSADEPKEFEDLTQNNVIVAFAKVLENTKEVIKRHRPAFFNIFVKLGNDINRFSRHINNSWLRKVYFHIGFMQTTYREYLNYDLQERLLEAIDNRAIQPGEGTNEVLRSMSTNLTVSCISDDDGRKIIDIEQFWRDLGITEDSIQENNHLLADKLLSALDSILDDYVQYHSTELIGYINDMLEKCHQGRSEEDEDKKWYPLLSETSNIAVELDRKAISWQRVQQSQEKV